MRKYETFLEFLLDGPGDENTAIEHGIMERISVDSHRAMLTDSGSDLLLERLSVFFNSGQELSSEQIYLTSEFLHFGQLFGGGSFVELFRAKFSVHFLNNLTEKFGGELTEAEKERNNAFERPYEAEWRIRLYTECIDIASGYETYMLYQPSTLCFESCRVLSSKLYFLLSALLLCNCEQFADLCKEKQNPVWPLLIIDRFQGASPLNQALSDDLTTVMPHLNNGQRSVLIAHYWQSVKAGCTEVFDSGLVKALQRLMPQESLQILARITSDLSRDSFPNMSGGNREKHSKQRKTLEIVIRWLAGWLNASGVKKDTVVENFVNNLYGRVNSEEKWVGLLLAKELQSTGDPYSLNLAAAIRTVIIGDFPKYWEKGARKDSELYFSGEQSLVLIEELADALFLQGEATEVLAWLSNVKPVASPAKLWVFRDLHQYGKYLNEKVRTAAHALLTLRVIDLYNQEKRISKKDIEGVINFLTSFIREISSGSHFENGQLIFDELFYAMGLTLNTPELFDHNFSAKILSYVNSSRIIINILSPVEDKEIRDQIMPKLNQTLDVDKFLLQTSELLNLGQRLVKAREYETAIEVLDGINVDNLQGEQFTGWKMLKAHAVLQKAFLAKQIDEQIKSLQAVLKVLNFPRKNGQYEGNSEDVKILKLQVMGWLVDRGAMDTVELMNAYNMISIIDAVNGKWDLGIYSEGRQYVCALSLVRILNHLPVESKNIREEEMELLCEKMQDVSGQEGVQALIRSWYAERRQNWEEQAMWIEKIDLTMDNEWLPLPLKRYLNKLSKVSAQDIQ